MLRAMAEELWTLLKVLTWTQSRFTERGIPTPRLDAELLLSHVLKAERIYLYTHFDQPMQPPELLAFRELIKRRLAGEPIAYLIGRREFRSIDLEVDSRVLIPRPDSETLVEVALDLLSTMSEARVVDVGTGSGAIAIAIARNRADLTVEAVDLSSQAAELARRNAARHAPSVVVHVGNLLAPIEGVIDLVVANLPYIPSADIANLALEVQHEPRLALDGGVDGLEIVRRLIIEAVGRLRVGGAIALEIGAGQAQETEELLRASGFTQLRRTRDLGGIERVVSGVRQ